MQFGDLFDYNEFLKERTDEQIGHEIVKEQTQRNQLLHTISSSFLFIMLSVGTLLTLVMLPSITKEGERKMIFITMIFALAVLVLLIWVTQWAFGFIPIIYNRPWINYTLQFLLNIIVFTIISIKQKK